MISVKLGTCDLSDKIPKFSESFKKLEDSTNNFTTADGKIHRCILGVKHKISLAYENLTDTEKNDLIDAISTDTISGDVNGTIRTYYGDVVPSELCYADTDGNHWDLSFTLEEV